jgi:FtsP/CotA-like multicopper oxidase with cupredoxin domain
LASAVTTMADPEYTTPIVDPAFQPKWLNAIPNALMAAFTYTPYAAGAALTAGFPASANCGVAGAGGEDCYTITVQQTLQNTGLVDDTVAGTPPLPTRIWGYGSATNPPAVGPFTAGLWHAPAMTFRNTSNRPTRITWLNQLPNVEQPGFDPTLCGTSAPDCYPYNRIVTHVHGAHVLDDSDGIPEQWFTPNFAITGNLYQLSKYGPAGTFRYPNTQEAGTIWYHDHATGVTHLNTQMGMAGFYLITDDNETCLQGVLAPGTGGCPVGQAKVLPTDPYEVGFALQDRNFWPSGEFALPDLPIRNLLAPQCQFDPITGEVIPTTCPTIPFSKAADGHLIPYSPNAPNPGPFTAKSSTLEYFGNVPMVNGVIYGTYDVEPRVYRMRFIGGTDSRTWILQLEDLAAPGVAIPFWQIGSEQGFLNNPVSRNAIDLMPGERIDVLVDLKLVTPGATLVLKNLGPDAPYAGPFDPPAPASTLIPEIMRFNVVPLNPAIADVPSPTAAVNLRPVSGPIEDLPAPTAPVRNVSLMEITDKYGRTQPTVDSRGFMEMGMPPTELIRLNDVEEWHIINTTVDAHPMHLHLVAFQVLNRQLFDPVSFVPPVTDLVTMLFQQPSYTNAAASSPIAPFPWEAGWKDTIDCPPGYVTRVKARFDIEGAYVWHCHILSHEEHDMMRPMVVRKPRFNADFDGDGRTDIAVFRPGTGDWEIRPSYNQTPYTLNYGSTGDQLVPGDYDGDGRSDLAVFRPSVGIWYIRNSATATQTVTLYGTAGDIPVPGDYDGDGKTDIAVFRPSNGIWFITNSGTGAQTTINYGTAGDIPVTGDYDGDGKTDIAVFRPSMGVWFITNSDTGTETLRTYGIATDTPVPADYDHDGKTDIAVWRSTDGVWYIINSATGSQSTIQYGTTGDIPVPGDYDSIGRTEVAVWRPAEGNWYIRNADNNTNRIVKLGTSADQPITSGQPLQ